MTRLDARLYEAAKQRYVEASIFEMCVCFFFLQDNFQQGKIDYLKRNSLEQSDKMNVTGRDICVQTIVESTGTWSKDVYCAMS